jgi:hypothetical protein
MKHAGVGSRTAAFLIDILPIVGLCVVMAYAFFDYGEVWQARRARPDDLELFREFVESGNGCDHALRTSRTTLSGGLDRTNTGQRNHWRVSRLQNC